MGIDGNLSIRLYKGNFYSEPSAWVSKLVGRLQIKQETRAQITDKALIFKDLTYENIGREVKH